MKKFCLALTFIIMLFPFTVSAADKVITVKVLGMVCDFCAQSVLKVFEENENVTNIDINLDEATVKLSIKTDGDISDEEINQKIEYGGYTVEDIIRL